MEILKGLIVTAKAWEGNSVVKGKLMLVNLKTDEPLNESNVSNSTLVIESENGFKYLINPLTLEYEADRRVKKWDDLDNRLSKYFMDENGKELTESEIEKIDASDIGEICLRAFGY